MPIGRRLLRRVFPWVYQVDSRRGKMTRIACCKEGRVVHHQCGKQYIYCRKSLPAFLELGGQGAPERTNRLIESEDASTKSVFKLLEPDTKRLPFRSVGRQMNSLVQLSEDKRRNVHLCFYAIVDPCDYRRRR